VQVITPIDGTSDGLDLTPAIFTGKDGKKYHLIDARRNLAAANWQLKHHSRSIVGAFRDQFHPKRKSNSWRVIEIIQPNQGAS
jgi:hypothetical protein